MAPSPSSLDGRPSPPAIDPSFTRYLDVQVLVAARGSLLRGASSRGTKGARP